MPPPPYPPPPAYAPPTYAPPTYAPPTYAVPQPPVVYGPPPRRPGIPTWLLTLLFAFAFLGLGAGVYWSVGYMRTRSGPTSTVESPAARPGAVTNPLQKYVEVSGLRFNQDAKQKTIVTFLLVNHSQADLSGLAGNVTVWGRTQKSEEDAQGTFSFTANLGPFESKELTAPLTTKLKIYELPDWQNVTTDLQITAPAASEGSPAPR